MLTTRYRSTIASSLPQVLTVKSSDIPMRQYVAVFALSFVALSGPCCTNAPDDTDAGSVFDASSDPASQQDVHRDRDVPDTPADAVEETTDTNLPPIANDVVRAAGQVARLGHLIDGDTMDLIVGDRTFAVRLRGINAPECEMEQNSSFRNRCVRDDEFYGLGAYEALVAIVDEAGPTTEFVVSCDGSDRAEPCGTDNYDRAIVYLDAPGLDLGDELVNAGAALSYTSFRSERRAKYCQSEYEAQAAGRGMWEGREPLEVISMMSTDTQNWYTQHNVRCDAAIEDL